MKGKGNRVAQMHLNSHQTGKRRKTQKQKALNISTQRQTLCRRLRGKEELFVFVRFCSWNSSTTNENKTISNISVVFLSHSKEHWYRGAAVKSSSVSDQLVSLSSCFFSGELCWTSEATLPSNGVWTGWIVGTLFYYCASARPAWDWAAGRPTGRRGRGFSSQCQTFLKGTMSKLQF